MSPPHQKQRVADAISELETRQDKIFERIFNRLEAVERGMVGTPDEPGGLTGKVAVLANDVTHRFDKLADKLNMNTALTGLVGAGVVAAACKYMFGG